MIGTRMEGWHLLENLFLLPRIVVRIKAWMGGWIFRCLFFVCDVFTCKYYRAAAPSQKANGRSCRIGNAHILDKTCWNIKYHEAKNHKSNRQGEQNCVVRDSLAHVASLSCEVHPELEGPVWWMMQGAGAIRFCSSYQDLRTGWFTVGRSGGLQLNRIKYILFVMITSIYLI